MFRRRLAPRGKLAVALTLAVTGIFGVLGAASSVVSYAATNPPAVTTEPAEDVGLTHASLQGLIQPNGSATTYHFDYGTTTNYDQRIPVAQDGDAGSGTVVEAVANPVYGLQPGTTYHYRLVATNDGGTTTGVDQIFTTATSAQPSSCPNGQFRRGRAAELPNCRAWELVSPPDKQGGDVVPRNERIHAAVRETPSLPMAVGFTSLEGFRDVQGISITSEYVAQRTLQPDTNGWTTHATTPPQQPGNISATLVGDADPHYEGDFSADLTHAVFSAFSPLTDAANVADVPNLYLRNDLRTPGFGSWTLLTNATSPLSPSLMFANFADASADFSHVIFESFQSLTPEVPPCTPVAQQGGGPCSPHLYEAVNGVVRLAGVLPDGSAAPSSVAGQGVNLSVSGAHFAYHTISDNGRRIFFSDPSSGNLYLRTDGATTVQINAPEDHGPDGILDPGQSTFADASGDGSRAFFTGGGHLYMYSVQADGAGHHLTRLDVGTESQDAATATAIGAIGVSDDGRYVYFIEAGQLVSGKPVLGSHRGIYVWHDESGTPRMDYVGELADAFDATQNLNSAWVAWPPVARVTPDGGHLLFAATDGSGLTGYDQTSSCVNDGGFDGQFGCTQLYEYSVRGDGPDHAHLHCATCDPSGAPATGDATDVVQDTADGGGLVFPTNHESHALSDDGRFVFFHTNEALVPQDVNGRQDVYEYDLAEGSIHLLSGGTDNADSYFADASADGRDAFFTTRSQLVGWDQDTARDLYDARVNGGVPDPVPGLLPCTDSACRGTLRALTTGPAPGTATAQGTGNAPTVKHRHKRLVCRRGFVKKRVRHRVRCVRKHRHRRRHHSARRASVPVHADRKGR
jgi:hypothetical protein